METVCQLSYPLNSENASPFGTRTVYLAWPVSCAEVAPLPRTASTERASDSTTITTAAILLLFIDSPRCHLVCQHGPYGAAESGTHGWKGQALRYCDGQAPALFFHFGDPLQAALGWSLSTRCLLRSPNAPPATRRCGGRSNPSASSRYPFADRCEFLLKHSAALRGSTVAPSK